VRPSHRAIGVQLRDEGNMSAIVVRNIVLTAQWQNRTWWGAAEAVAVSRLKRHTDSSTIGALHSMLLANISGSSEAGVVLVGDETHPIASLTLRNIHLRLERLTGFPGGFRDLRPGPADIEPAAPGALYARNVQQLTVAVRPLLCSRLPAVAVFCTIALYGVVLLLALWSKLALLCPLAAQPPWGPTFSCFRAIW
jgi:hypothetical protein